jgi:uncharacterized protein
MLYLDTSILVSALTKEPRTGAVRAWLAQQPSGQLTISDWVITEFSSALSIKVRTGAIDPAQHGAILGQFTQWAVNSFGRLPVEAISFHTAVRFCDQSQLNLRSGDALHLAICAEHGATICTLDQVLGQAAPVLGVALLML